MHLLLKTRVSQSIDQVWAGFDRSLFEALTPLFPPVRIIRFDGSLPGNIVHLQLQVGFSKQDWISKIVDQQSTPTEISFVDEGIKLPFFLTYWRHHHRLCRWIDPTTGHDYTDIIDDITFETPTKLTNYLLYPVLWLQFACRKPTYRRRFSGK